jgi:hypothetical protein
MVFRFHFFYAAQSAWSNSIYQLRLLQYSTSKNALRFAQQPHRAKTGEYIMDVFQ